MTGAVILSLAFLLPQWTLFGGFAVWQLRVEKEMKKRKLQEYIDAIIGMCWEHIYAKRRLKREWDLKYRSAIYRCVIDLWGATQVTEVFMKEIIINRHQQNPSLSVRFGWRLDPCYYFRRGQRLPSSMEIRDWETLDPKEKITVQYVELANPLVSIRTFSLELMRQSLGELTKGVEKEIKYKMRELVFSRKIESVDDMVDRRPEFQGSEMSSSDIVDFLRSEGLYHYDIKWDCGLTPMDIP